VSKTLTRRLSIASCTKEELDQRSKLMWLVLHPKVYSDIDEIMGYYKRVATPGLGEEFYTELRYFVTQVADKPRSFSIRERDIRRANLRRFP
jgi:hypothetical protein